VEGIKQRGHVFIPNKINLLEVSKTISFIVGLLAFGVKQITYQLHAKNVPCRKQEKILTVFSKVQVRCGILVEDKEVECESLSLFRLSSSSTGASPFKFLKIPLVNGQQHFPRIPAGGKSLGK